MSEIVLVIQETEKRHAKFYARVKGELICTSETPFFSAARGLLERGLAQPDDVLVMRREGSEVVSLRAKVQVAADSAIAESSSGSGLRRRKYTPHPYALGPPIAQNGSGVG